MSNGDFPQFEFRMPRCRNCPAAQIKGRPLLIVILAIWPSSSWPARFIPFLRTRWASFSGSAVRPLDRPRPSISKSPYRTFDQVRSNASSKAEFGFRTTTRA